MLAKNTLKTEAITLRKEGKTYNEILKRVPVAKSTLSLWLRSVGMAKPQFQLLTEKKRASQLRGGVARREKRIFESQKIFALSEVDIGSLSKRELFLIGVALYWAEGSKAKEYRPSVGIDFANSDPEMVKVFMQWLRVVFGLKSEHIMLTVHLHENQKSRIEEVEAFWLKVTQLPRQCLTKPIYKKHNPKTKRKNIGATYVGLVAISVRGSTNMNRRIQGWIYGIISSQKRNCQIV